MKEFSSEIYCAIRIKSFLKILSLIMCCACIFPACQSNRSKWKYEPFSKAVIQLDVISDPPNTYYITADKERYTYYFFDYSNALKVDSAGVYYLDFEIDLPCEITTYIGEKDYRVFVFPNDTTVLRIDFNNNGYNLEFAGSTRNINNYLTEKAVYHKSLDIFKLCESLRHRRFDYEDFVDKVDSIVLVEWEYLNDKKAKYHLSRNYIDYEMYRVFYYGLERKLERGLVVGRYDRMGRFIKSEDPPPDLYYVFIQNPSLNNTEAIYTNNYFNYISTYIRHIAFKNPDSRAYYKMPYGQRKLKELAKANEVLRGKTRQIYLEKELYSLVGGKWFDAEFIDSLAAVYHISQLQDVQQANGRNESRQLKPGERLMEIYMSDPDYDLFSIRYFQDQNLVLRLCNQQPDSSTVDNLIFEKLADDYAHNEDIEFISIYMHVEPDEWLASMTDDSDDIGNDFMVEFGWNRELTHMFGIERFPHFVIIGMGNILIRSEDHISLADQYLLDSLLLQLDESI